jgi:hypothetical protein
MVNGFSKAERPAWLITLERLLEGVEIDIVTGDIVSKPKTFLDFDIIGREVPIRKVYTLISDRGHRGLNIHFPSVLYDNETQDLVPGVIKLEIKIEGPGYTRVPPATAIVTKRIRNSNPGGSTFEPWDYIVEEVDLWFDSTEEIEKYHYPILAGHEVEVTSGKIISNETGELK